MQTSTATCSQLIEDAVSSHRALSIWQNHAEFVPFAKMMTKYLQLDLGNQPKENFHMRGYG